MHLVSFPTYQNSQVQNVKRVAVVLAHHDDRLKYKMITFVQFGFRIEFLVFKS